MSEKTCKECGSVGSFEDIAERVGPHYGKRICVVCGANGGWIPKPKNENKRPNNKHTAASLGFTTCQMCERPVDRLGDFESLEVHHVKEIHCGGEDTPENIWCVCTPCHKQIHHNRVYLNDHHKNRMTKAHLVELMDRDNVPDSVRGHFLQMLERSHGQV